MINEAGGFLEPEDSFNEDTQPEYPFNNVTQTESGHIFELDDTRDRERIKLMHRSGTFIEMNPDGSEVHKVFGDGYEITVKDKQVLVKGKCSVTIMGDSIVEIQGNKTEQINGDYNLLILGDFNQEVKGKTSITSQKQLDLVSNPTFGGRLNLNAGGTIHVNGDFSVDGSIMCDKLMASTRVDAGLGMSAGPYGFVTVTGGFSAGVPVAIPGCVTCILNVNAGVSVNAPLGLFLVSKATFMTDVVNVRLHNIHFHKAPKGFTGTPLIKMV